MRDYFFGSMGYAHGPSRKGARAWSRPDGWGKTLHGEEDENFVYRGRYAIPKKWACGNYSTREESPYGYAIHVVKGSVKVYEGENYDAVYDDRLRQWYPERWERACTHLSSNYFKEANLLQLSAFLSELFGYHVKCLQVLEGCNVGNGYPYFVFVYEKNPNASPMIVYKMELEGRIGDWSSKRRHQAYHSFPLGIPRAEADEILKGFARSVRDVKSRFYYLSAGSQR